ncbi:methyl-accepting chemotaxis protein [Liquorilactobacillus capillatus]|uniref:Methyl-accepting chemotaxis sensory transducer n=2 Tax=Liquorilactobacillus capillatus TaxID=480931 RepID=A0A0R1M2B6_9LACO|nr:methyl-accepting chemotaxis protein [Liquorilactobacillus capillatus]AJA33882.1 methyl-accepting chemotaxis protein [Liquorilactobacillus capillatus]KRL02094.1 methyl-accepting chemotaxis sensory transducer [Liquorilactobacillus capillatus DSM 19910]
MGKKFLGFFKNLSLRPLIPAGVTALILIICYFFIVRGVADEQTARSFIIFSVVVVVIYAIANEIITLMLAGAETVEMKNLQKILDAVSSGDMTQLGKFKSTSSDNAVIAKVKDGFHGVINAFVAMIVGIKEESGHMNEIAGSLSTMSKKSSGTIENIRATMNNIADASTSQTTEAEQTASDMQKLASNIEEINKEVAHMSDYVTKANESNAKNTEMVMNVSDSWTKERNNQAEIVGEMDDMNKDIQNIGNIVQLINDISEQTNLLALNASIEAARAGEAGRGFAIVAEEVRTLAEESGKSAKNIRDIIEVIRDKSKHMTTAMNESYASGEQQTDNLDKAMDSTKEISGMVEKFVESINVVEKHISGVVEEKDTVTKSMENITSAIAETSAGTQEATANVEEFYNVVKKFEASVKDIEDIASVLKFQVDSFKV